MLKNIFPEEESFTKIAVIKYNGRSKIMINKEILTSKNRFKNQCQVGIKSCSTSISAVPKIVLIFSAFMRCLVLSNKGTCKETNEHTRTYNEN